MSASSSSSSSASAASPAAALLGVSCPAAPSLPMPAVYRKKNFSRQFPKELYVRSDLACHTLLCDEPLCRALGATSRGASSQSAMDQVGVLDPQASHYVVPAFHALDRFHAIFTRSRLIHLFLLRSHAAQCGRALERRLDEMLQDAASARRVVMFENEHHASACTRLRAGESAAQRFVRAERRAAKFFAQHLHGRKAIILIEADEAPTSEADEARAVAVASQYPRESAGVTIHSMASYLSWLATQHPADEEPKQLMLLYDSLLEAERSKLRAKAAQKAAAEQLEAMLASLRVEWKLRTSSEGPLPSASSINEAEASSDSLPGSNSTQPVEMEHEEHIPLAIALEAVQRGLLLRGHMHVNKYHAQHDASVDLGGRMLDSVSGALVEGAGEGRTGEVFLSGQVDRNRAIDGDEVVVQMLPQTLWRAPTQRRMLSVKDAAAEESKNEDDEAAADQADLEARPVPTGRVVAIIRRNLRPYVATLQLESIGGDFSLAVPMNECIPKIRLRTHQARELSNQRLLVQIEGWEADSKYPSGIYLKSLGSIGEIETGVRCILAEHEISHPPFSAGMMRGLPERTEDPAMKARKYKVGSGYHSRGEPTPFSWSIPAEAMVGRRDLRQTHRDAVCSIDPIGCEDIDDALSSLLLPNGNVQIGVHIADVSHFVQAGSLLDQEAARRGTSVYLVDRRLDMLPATLSADLCSLRGGCERLCVSVLWEIEPKTGAVVHTWFGRTAIFNAFALSYEEAQYIFDTQGGTVPLPKLPPNHPDAHLTLEERYDKAPQSSLTAAERKMLYPKISSLLVLGRMLRARRIEVGALELDSLTIKFRMDDAKQITGVVNEADLEVHSTIAEWMVFANSTVAYHIYQAFPRSAMLRHHPIPAPNRFEKMTQLAKALGISIDVSSNKALATSLSKAEEIVQSRDFVMPSSSASQLLSAAGDKAMDSSQSKQWVMRLLKEMAARAMSEAQYMSTGSVANVRAFFHYGLSADFYTHFTSPIRRYADLVVHRQLLAIVDEEAAQRKVGKAEVKVAKAEARGESSSSAALVPASAPAVDFSNDTVQAVARHLNHKNRSAKIAGSESETLFLSCFLAGDQPGVKRELAPASSLSGVRPKVERCEGLIVSLRANGFVVLLPRFHVKGALLLLDKQDRANVAHPLDLAFPAEDDEAEGNPRAPRARIDFNEATQELTYSLAAALPAPLSAPPGLASALPLTHVFHLFDPIVVDVSLRSSQSRYRTPKPVFRLVWHATEIGPGAAASKKQKELKVPSISQEALVGVAATNAIEGEVFSTGPQAPAGARKAKAAPGVKGQSLYDLLRTVKSTTAAAAISKGDSEEKSNSVGDRKLQGRAAARVRHRYTGALGGRLLFTPTGQVPSELMKSSILKAKEAGGGAGVEEEEY